MKEVRRGPDVGVGDLLLQPGVERLGRGILVQGPTQLEAQAEERQEETQAAIREEGEKIRKRRLDKQGIAYSNKSRRVGAEGSGGSMDSQYL